MTVSAQNEIEVLTEPSPFTTLYEASASGGEATTFVRKVLEEANIKYKLSFVPWKRSFQYSLNKANVLIYPIARTAQREGDFIWLGNIVPINYFFFKLKSRADITLNNLNDAKRFKLGVVNNHAHHEYLISKGFTEFQTVNSNAQNLQKLLLGRIELFPLSSGGLLPLCQQLEIDCSQIVSAFTLEDFSAGLYMAFSKGSDPELVRQVKASYLQQKSLPSYNELFHNRLALAREVEANK